MEAQRRSVLGEKSRMSRILGSALAVLAGMSMSALAQEPGSAEAGHELARNLCTSCHIVGNETSGSDLAPPFLVIARDPNTTPVALHSWDEAGHPTLSHLALTPKQVADIDAYLDSLRGREPSGAAAEFERTLPQAPPDRIGAPIGSTSN
jgi:mono/diheme cytochrome c family protein